VGVPALPSPLAGFAAVVDAAHRGLSRYCRILDCSGWDGDSSRSGGQEQAKAEAVAESKSDVKKESARVEYAVHSTSRRVSNKCNNK
jgi:hypothetical protein